MEDIIERKISEFSTRFDSEEIKDADSIEASSFEYRNWFVALDYRCVQPHFDDFFRIALKIAGHYRPPVQANGCDCLYVVAAQGAPAQVKRVAPEIRACADKLVQVGHSEVMPSLMPLVAHCAPLIFGDASGADFHAFFLHFLETWSRESTTAAASYAIAQAAVPLLRFAGLCTARYIGAITAIARRRLALSSSISHARRFAEVALCVCREAYPVIAARAEEVRAVAEQCRRVAAESGSSRSEAALLDADCSEIERILADAPLPPAL